MKINHRIIFSTALLSQLLLWAACGKSIFEKDYPGFDGKVLMAQATEGRNIIPIAMSSTPAQLAFGASYGKSMGGAPKDIPVEFELKNDWITGYNAQNNTNYIPLPEGSDNISGLSSVIKKGKTTSEPLTITIKSKELDVKERYMFPITLKSAGGEKIDSALTTTWFRIDEIIRPERDVAGQATLTVSHENRNGADAAEGSKKLVDNSTSTKFLVFDINTILPNFWYQLTFPAPIVLSAYTVTTGGDAPERDPRDWKLLGSNDGVTWVTVDTRTNQAFSGRTMTVRYEFENEVPYKIYRMAISAVNGGTLFQQSEFRVIEYFEQ